MNGTSFSAPQVSGAAAVLKSYYPNLRNWEIYYILKNSGKNINQYNTEYMNKLGTFLDIDSALKFKELPVPEIKNSFYKNGVLTVEGRYFPNSSSLAIKYKKDDGKWRTVAAKVPLKSGIYQYKNSLEGLSKTSPSIKVSLQNSYKNKSKEFEFNMLKQDVNTSSNTTKIIVKKEIKTSSSSQVKSISLSREDRKFRKDAKNSHFEKAILALKEKGILKGYTDGSFKPFNSINRAEFSKIVIGATGLTLVGKNCFSDVNDEWFVPYVCTAQANGIIRGYSDGTFRPGKEVNVVEALKITLGAFNVSVRNLKNNEEWYVPYVEYAKENNIYLDSFKDVTKTITREEMAELIYRIEG